MNFLTGLFWVIVILVGMYIAVWLLLVAIGIVMGHIVGHMMGKDGDPRMTDLDDMKGYASKWMKITYDLAYDAAFEKYHKKENP